LTTLKLASKTDDRTSPWDNAGLRARLSGVEIESRSIHDALREAIDQRLEQQAEAPAKRRRR
jgi:hypothetical protein